MLGTLKEPPVTEARPLRPVDRVLLFPPIHAAAYALQWIGLRNRLRCPSCKSVGTWKPHGTLSARRIHHDRPVRRWLCKWCGYYIGFEGVIRAFPDPSRGYWALPRPWDPNSPKTPGPTPADVLKAVLPKTWPWRG